MEFRIKSSKEFEDGDKQFHFISVEWKIKSFSGAIKSITSHEVSKFITSPSFSSCGDSGWIFSMFPIGEEWNGTGGKFAVYLVRHSFLLKFEYTAFSELIVHCSRGDKIFKTKHTFKETRVRDIITNTLTTSDLLPRSAGYLLDDTLTITCHIFIFCRDSAESSTDSAETLKDEKKPLLIRGSCLNLLSSDFEGLYNSSQLSDVTLKLGEEEFKAHKSVLGARSKVFAAMFEHDMRENLLDTVDLLQMEVETVSDMLRYIYCGRVRELSPEEALNLYVAADRYDLQELMAFCREAVLLKISVNNVCDIAQIAELHDDQLLIRELKSFLLENSKELIKTVKWKAMCAKNPVLCGKMFEWIFSE